MIRVYKYGLKPPGDFAEDCNAELERMNALWNKCVEIDHARDESFRQLCCNYSPDYKQALEEIQSLAPQIDDLYDDIRAERVKLHSKEPSDELKARKNELLGRRKALWEICKDIQKTVPKDLQKPLAEKYKADLKLARQKSGCFWGNYNAVMESFETAKSKAIKDGARLHFKKFDGAGRFVNQIQGGMTAERLLSGTHSQAQLTGLVTTNKTNGVFTFTAFTGRDAAGKRFRRNLSAVINYDRPIPEDGIIKAVEVIRTPHDGKQQFKWHVCFTVQLPDVEITHSKGNIAGLNLGWRQIGSKLRVAVLVDDKNQKTEYYLPAKVVQKFQLAEDLQQKADDAKNKILSWLREYYSEDKPQEWKEAAKAFWQGKLPAKNFYEAWRGSWLGMDAAFEAWYKEDRDLRRSYTGCRRNAVAWREEIYRHYAKEIAENYAVIAVTDTPLAAMSRTKGKDGLGIDNELPEAARRNRVIAGIYTLKEWIDKQAVKTGSIVEKIADKVTATCYKCGHITEKRTGSAQYYTCEGCATELEVDINAAINCRKLASGEVARNKKTSKSGRFTRIKEAKNDSARKSVVETTDDTA